MSDDARSEILSRIRIANSTEGSGVATDAWLSIDRAYNRTSSLETPKLLELLIDRLVDYDAQVETISPQDVASTISRILTERDSPRMLVARGFPGELLPAGSFTMDDAFTPSELDMFDGILTQSALAIAETGTLVLQNVPGQGRRAATLVPDFHLCLLQAADVVKSVPEAMNRLSSTAHLPTTFISGPSATADIEMTRIKGVHGPRFLHVIIVD